MEAIAERTIQIPKPLPWQAKFISDIREKEPRLVVAPIGRRAGKTHGGLLIAITAAIKKAVATRKLGRLKRIEKGEPGWQGTAWAMERQYPEQFGPPLMQLRRKAEEKTEMSNQELFRYLVESDAAVRRLTARD
jgi:hypothetical protein